MASTKYGFSSLFDNFAPGTVPTTPKPIIFPAARVLKVIYGFGRDEEAPKPDFEEILSKAEDIGSTLFDRLKVFAETYEDETSKKENEALNDFNKVGGWNGVGAIKFQFLGRAKKLETERDVFAYPLFPNIVSPPVVDEIVYIVTLPSSTSSSDPGATQYYYFPAINIWNSANNNALLSIEKETLFGSIGESQLKDDYEQVGEAGALVAKRTKPENVDEETDKDPYFRENKYIRNLLVYPGDYIMQGRWGNSIRFGSTSTPQVLGQTPNFWSLDNKEDREGSTTDLTGNPIIIIRNGQDPRWDDEPKNTWVPVTENPNLDKSSIILTSNQTIPIDVASNYARTFRNVSGGAISDLDNVESFNYVEPDNFSEITSVPPEMDLFTEERVAAANYSVQGGLLNIQIEQEAATAFANFGQIGNAGSGQNIVEASLNLNPANAGLIVNPSLPAFKRWDEQGGHKLVALGYRPGSEFGYVGNNGLGPDNCGIGEYPAPRKSTPKHWGNVPFCAAGVSYAFAQFHNPEAPRKFPYSTSSHWHSKTAWQAGEKLEFKRGTDYNSNGILEPGLQKLKIAQTFKGAIFNWIYSSGSGGHTGILINFDLNEGVFSGFTRIKAQPTFYLLEYNTGGSLKFTSRQLFNGGRWNRFFIYNTAAFPGGQWAPSGIGFSNTYHRNMLGINVSQGADVFTGKVSNQTR